MSSTSEVQEVNTCLFAALSSAVFASSGLEHALPCNRSRPCPRPPRPPLPTCAVDQTINRFGELRHDDMSSELFVLATNFLLYIALVTPHFDRAPLLSVLVSAVLWMS